ncbi:hypothetical protein [Fibrobacter sp.]|uniref:hypothetical protein n=1 Tax=Fibrobacter sp. TaxID=35828 RepID=UPI00386A6BC6
MAIFVYSVQMTRLFAYILLLSLFLLAACDSAKKEFETLKAGEILLDVNTEEYSLNGKVLGKTANDISATNDFIDKPLQKELCDTRGKFLEEALRNGESIDDLAKLHVDGNLSYVDFYKVLYSMHYCGYLGFKIAIGSNYKDAFYLSIPSVDYMWCGFVIQRMKGLRYKYLRIRQKLSLDEMLKMSIKDRECVEDYKGLDLLLSFYRKDDGIAYVISYNETFFNKGDRFEGYNFYTFNNESDLWKFIEDVRLRVGRQTEKIPDKKENRVLKLLADTHGSNNIMLAFEKDVLMKDIAPIIKKLNTYGYRFAFSIVDSN